ncbi:MAG: hypothetical protein QOF51_3214 [Chloroflexota bacterium]|nr:hypothetical protein [Chloroflexota bacterium]
MPELNFHQLRIFAAVAQYRSFSRAARELKITQPAVSTQVRQFEEDLGIVLIDRVGRHVSLTDAGRIVAEHAQRLFDIADNMLESVESLRDVSRGRLVLGASHTIGQYVLPALLGRYRRAHPGVDLALELAAGPTILERVIRHQIDVGFVANEVHAREIVATTFATDEIVLVASPLHPLAEAAAIGPEDLAACDWVARDVSSETRRLVDRRLADAGFTLQPMLELASNEAVKQAVMANLGVAMLSRNVVALELEVGRLVALPAGVECRRSFSYIVRRDRQLSRPERTFLDLLGN